MTHSSPGSAPVDVTFLGHATVLIEMAGVRILTDPFLRPRLDAVAKLVTS